MRHIQGTPPSGDRRELITSSAGQILCLLRHAKNLPPAEAYGFLKTGLFSVVDALAAAIDADDDEGREIIGKAAELWTRAEKIAETVAETRKKAALKVVHLEGETTADIEAALKGASLPEDVKEVIRREMRAADARAAAPNN